MLRNRFARIALQVGTLALFLACWELIARTIDARFLPSPMDVGTSVWSGSFDGTFLEHVIISLRRVLVGLGVAVVVGVPTGLVFGRIQPLRRALYPLVKFVFPIPVAALIPVVLVITGIRDLLYVSVVAIATGIPLIIATVDAVRQTDPVLLESAAVLGAPRTSLFTRVLIPAVLPRVVHASYVSSSIGLIVLITAEILVSTKGMGHVLVLAQRQYRVADMFAGIVVVGVVGMALSVIVRFVGNRIAGWEAASLKKQWG
ncbi:MAG: ABC transporter permease subunit [Acidimicrobiia bacterium]|nr:ABC transporter permease subunit [Acidimicrobiia bacterium]